MLRTVTGDAGPHTHHVYGHVTLTDRHGLMDRRLPHVIRKTCIYIPTMNVILPSLLFSLFSFRFLYSRTIHFCWLLHVLPNRYLTLK